MAEHQCVACKQYRERSLLHRRTIELRPGDPDSVKDWFVCCDCYPDNSLKHLHIDDKDSAYPTQ